MGTGWLFGGVCFPVPADGYLWFRIASPQTRRSHPLDADHREPEYVRS